MAFYHVIVQNSEPSSGARVLFSDLLEADLLARFVDPYSRGSDLMVSNEIHPVRAFRKVWIVETEEPEVVVRKMIYEKSARSQSELNRNSRSIVFMGLPAGYDPEDILEGGIDVTAKYLLGPPGFINNPGKSEISALPSDDLLKGQQVEATELVTKSGGSWFNHPWVVSVGSGLIIAAILAIAAAIL